MIIRKSDYSLEITGEAISEKWLDEKIAEYKLCHLEELHLHKCFLSEIPEYVKKYSQLKTLCCAGNFIDEIPNFILELLELEILKLDYNDINLLPEFIYKHPKLSFISLQYLKNLFIEPGCLKHQKFITLALQGTGITNLPMIDTTKPNVTTEVYLELDRKYDKKNYISIDVMDDLKDILTQYLTGFHKFVKVLKGESVSFLIGQTMEGIRIEWKDVIPDHEQILKIKQYLQDYLRLSLSPLEDLHNYLIYPPELSLGDKMSFTTSMNFQVQNLKNQIELQANDIVRLNNDLRNEAEKNELLIEIRKLKDAEINKLASELNEFKQLNLSKEQIIAAYLQIIFNLAVANSPHVREPNQQNITNNYVYQTFNECENVSAVGSGNINIYTSLIDSVNELITNLKEINFPEKGISEIENELNKASKAPDEKRPRIWKKIGKIIGKIPSAASQLKDTAEINDNINRLADIIQKLIASLF